MNLWWWVGVILWTAFTALVAYLAGHTNGYADATSPEGIASRMAQGEDEGWVREDLERSKQANALAREYLKDGSPGTHPRSQ